MISQVFTQFFVNKNYFENGLWKVSPNIQLKIIFIIFLFSKFYFDLHQCPGSNKKNDTDCKEVRICIDQLWHFICKIVGTGNFGKRIYLQQCVQNRFLVLLLKIRLILVPLLTIAEIHVDMLRVVTLINYMLVKVASRYWCLLELLYRCRMKN